MTCRISRGPRRESTIGGRVNSLAFCSGWELVGSAYSQSSTVSPESTGGASFRQCAEAIDFPDVPWGMVWWWGLSPFVVMGMLAVAAVLSRPNGG